MGLRLSRISLFVVVEARLGLLKLRLFFSEDLCRDLDCVLDWQSG